jgi:hypothetical protein
MLDDETSKVKQMKASLHSMTNQQAADTFTDKSSRQRPKDAQKTRYDEPAMKVPR